MRQLGDGVMCVIRPPISRARGGARGAKLGTSCAYVHARVDVPEYPAQSRGRWIISRLSRPWAGTEPSIFLFPQRPLRLEPLSLFFFSLLVGDYGVLAEERKGSMALSDIPRLETTLSTISSFFLENPRTRARGIHPVGREMYVEVAARPTDWWNPPRQGIDPLFANGPNVQIFFFHRKNLRFWSENLSFLLRWYHTKSLCKVKQYYFSFLKDRFWNKLIFTRNQNVTTSDFCQNFTREKGL